MRRCWAWLALIITLPNVTPGAAAEPRAYGYFVGDVVQRRVPLPDPGGAVLDPASLPQTRRLGQALELRAARLHRGELVLDYQVMRAPPQVQTLEMPPLTLRYTGPAGARSVRIDAWPVTVAPLVPLDVSPRTGLGELRPDHDPPLIDTGARRLRLAGYAAALFAAGVWLLHLKVGLAWWRGRRPFAEAWRTLRRLPDAAGPDQRRQAFLVVHQALNRSAGAVLFESGVADFVATRPRYAALREPLAAFFSRSRDEFFAGRADESGIGWLKALVHDCRDAERGTA